MDKKEVLAKVENLPEVSAFIDEKLEEAGCPMKVQMQIDVAVEEIFVNVASYAYEGKEGLAEIFFDIDSDKKVNITFVDSGVPYDPLKKDDPDVTLSADERQIGGLGIFMVKKTMDDMAYEYKDGKNRLTLIKSLV
ncbi:MAG: ATP-binding protein [Butyrivibrio sp.]|nr:ATP-binding protein [Butyrivibrio sp.]